MRSSASTAPTSPISSLSSTVVYKSSARSTVSGRFSKNDDSEYAVNGINVEISKDNKSTGIYCTITPVRRIGVQTLAFGPYDTNGKLTDKEVKPDTGSQGSRESGSLKSSRTRAGGEILHATIEGRRSTIVPPVLGALAALFSDSQTVVDSLSVHVQNIKSSITLDTESKKVTIEQTRTPTLTGRLMGYNEVSTKLEVDNLTEEKWN